MTSATVFSHFDGLTCTACATCVLAPGALEKAGGGTTVCPASMPLSAASPARTLAQQAKAQVFALARALVFGSSSRVLLANYDRALSCWKTCQLSLPGMEMSLLKRLPRWGMTRDGELYERPMPGLLTSANDGFAWPTPTTRDWRDGRSSAETMERNSRPLNETVMEEERQRHIEWALGISEESQPPMNWPTPQAQDGERGFDYKTAERKSRGETRPSGGKIGSSLKHEPGLLPDIQKNGWKGQLNPDWVETLMGFPPGWTDPTIAYTSRDLGSLNTTGSQPESPAAATSEPAA